jgi:hypothetical protein
MTKNHPKPPEDDSSDLVKFKRLAMRVVSVQKDEVYELYQMAKPKAAKKAAAKTRRKP